jgi:heterodisulfide reductase subunit C
MIVSDMGFRTQVNALSGQHVENCYHCHTCTAGCPVSECMEYGPDRIIRLIEMGHGERVLSSADIWLCAGCETCATRCPNEIDVAGVMDALRQLSRAEGFAAPTPRIPLFHRIFLQVVEKLGRSHELVMLMFFKLLSRDLLSDLDSGAALVLKGKIPLIPKRMKQADEVQRIFQAAQQADHQLMEAHGVHERKD